MKVLYILGWKRSGSTILGNLIGELDDFFHAGELRTLWGQGLLGGRLCGCGRAVTDCDFWAGVVASVMRTSGHAGAERILAWQRETVRMRRFRRLLRHDSSLREGSLGSYAAVMADLYRAVAVAAGARVVVDSSKQPADAALASRLPGIDTFYLHLVRDPRAVAYSWQRWKPSPGEGKREEMMRVASARSTANWMAVNCAAEVIRRRAGRDRMLLVRYEDFVSFPQATLEAAARMVGEEFRPLPESRPGSFRLRPNHTAGGNPARFVDGVVRLRVDDEWIVQQSPRDRRTSTLVALPLLPRYGYPIAPRAEAASDKPREDSGKGKEPMIVKRLGRSDED